MTAAAIASVFSVPTRDAVSESNQFVFDQIKKGLGMVPNLYAVFAYSPTALSDYLALQNRKSSLTAKEREVINLVVSQVNECEYCLAAHTVIGAMRGFSHDQMIEIRRGNASFDTKLNALAKFVKETSENRGKPSQATVQELLNAGYTPENVVDIVLIIGDKTVTNYLHGITQTPVDFPAAPPV